MTDHLMLPTVVVLIGTCVGAVTDVWKFRVYNSLTFPLLVTGLLYHGLVGGWPALTSSSLGVCFGFAILIIPYLLGLMGAGDVKLLAGVGAWLGLPLTVMVFVISSLVAGAYAVVLILYRGRIGESLSTLKLILYRMASLGMHFGKEDLVETLSEGTDRRLRVIPFGAMIPIGVIGALLLLALIK
ncbi:MAG: A24 family peptidase [Thermoguttaceae bacterium]